ncbi:MAG TPA: isoprenylcysteine carboxylmethyltransferase family protein [Vicinamibacterales bacterium]|nr:isoprenylcysteine carboxylmethyltransferase family protein [Vicinamibacterales bacterium]
MIDVDRYLLVRAASVYLTAICVAVVWFWRRPSRRAAAGAMLASVWNVPPLVALNLAAGSLGWWSFDAHGGTFLGTPVDLTLAWVLMWGFVPALAFPSWPLHRLVLLALVVDVVLMPAAFPVVALGPWWLAGEAVALLTCFVPGQVLARWTERDDCLNERATLQFVSFSGLLLFIIPAVAIEGSLRGWSNPLLRPAWQLGLILQILAVPGLLGLTALQEFVSRGRGTPVPFDPPRRLVTTGIYAYVRNPMQLSAVALLLLLGLIVHSVWVAAAGVMAHLYSLGLAGWDEDDDLRGRFGQEWIAYRSGVRAWIPRLHPWRPDGPPHAQLFVAGSCNACREVGRWFDRRGAAGLLIVPAETHPSGSLRRITYESVDGTYRASGTDAVARALEHVHLGWAMLGFLVRVPVVCHLIQLVVDASGGEPRQIAGPGATTKVEVSRATFVRGTAGGFSTGAGPRSMTTVKRDVSVHASPESTERPPVPLQAEESSS